MSSSQALFGKPFKEKKGRKVAKTEGLIADKLAGWQNGKLPMDGTVVRMQF